MTIIRFRLLTFLGFILFALLFECQKELNKNAEFEKLKNNPNENESPKPLKLPEDLFGEWKGAERSVGYLSITGTPDVADVRLSFGPDLFGYDKVKIKCNEKRYCQVIGKSKTKIIFGFQILNDKQIIVKEAIKFPAIYGDHPGELIHLIDINVQLIKVPDSE